MNAAGWRVVPVKAPAAPGRPPGLSRGRIPCWAALPPDGARDRARTFGRRADAARWAGDRALDAEAADVRARLAREEKALWTVLNSGWASDMDADTAVPVRTVFGLTVLLWRAEETIAAMQARLAAHGDERPDG